MEKTRRYPLKARKGAPGISAATIARSGIFSAFGFGSLEGCGAEFAIFEFISHQAKAQTNMFFCLPFSLLTTQTLHIRACESP